jgi:hypothetical protein
VGARPKQRKGGARRENVPTDGAGVSAATGKIRKGKGEVGRRGELG